MTAEQRIPTTAQKSWEIDRPLATEGQSVTYIVRHKDSSTTGVLKVQNDRPGASERIRHEAKILSTVNHPGVVRLVDTNAFTSDDRVYLVTEFIPGPTLSDLIGRTPASFQNALITCEILFDTLAHLHGLQSKVIHRDIKPKNIIMRDGSFEHPILIDFGIAYRIRNTELTGIRERIGNYFLELPEATEGPVDKRDFRSDITYVAGILLYMLTARHPKKLLETWFGSMPHERRDARRMLTSLDEASREALSRFFDKSFQFSRRQRLQSAQAAKQILADIRAGSIRQHPVTALSGARFAHYLRYDNQPEKKAPIASYRDQILPLIARLGELNRFDNTDPRKILQIFASGQEDHEVWLATHYKDPPRAKRVHSDTQLLLSVFDEITQCPNEQDEVWQPFISVAGPCLVEYLSSAIQQEEESQAEAWFDMMRDQE